MSRRTTLDYQKVISAVKKLIGTHSVREAVVDFERALWNALNAIFKGIQIYGCSFHFCQAIIRRLKRLGLANLYNHCQTFRFLVRKMLCLNLLPHSKIPSNFRLIEAELLQLKMPQVAQLCDYFSAQWIDTSIFHPGTWSVFNQPIRTNNHEEGWHNRLKSKGRAKMNLYDLLKLLHLESQISALNMDLHCANNLKTTQNLVHDSYEARLQKLWKKFKPSSNTNKKRISSGTLLNKAAELYFSLFSISFKHSKDDKKDESELIEFNDSLDGSFAESDVGEKQVMTVMT
jgi:hypothetical protein